jgi:hypothetical protein
MRKALLPALAATFSGFVAMTLSASVTDADGEFADFLARHDRLHPALHEQKPQHDVVVGEAVWNDADRTIYVDAETTSGKGALVVVEGLPVTDWVTAFKVAKSKSVSFQLPIPDNEIIPCRIIVRSAHAFRITRVIDAPPTCVADAEAENMLLASL